MKLAIWQQFSSNHSGGFSLIGQFETVEAAQKAHAVIQDIINQIAAYYREHPELEGVDLMPLTPVEEELAKQYGLIEKDWGFSVDWAETEADPRVSNQGLYIYQNLLFLSEPIETWLGAQPFDRLFTKLGAKIEVADFGIGGETNPVINMTCAAPNSEIAGKLVEVLSSSKTYSDGSVQPLIVLPGGHGPYDGEIRSVEAKLECVAIRTHSFRLRQRGHASEFLPDLIAYLESQGCKNFEFTISQRPLT